MLAIDDDLRLPPRFLDRFVALCERFALDLAQPAQTLRSPLGLEGRRGAGRRRWCARRASWRSARSPPSGGRGRRAAALPRAALRLGARPALGGPGRGARLAPRGGRRTAGPPRGAAGGAPTTPATTRSPRPPASWPTAPISRAPAPATRWPCTGGPERCGCCSSAPTCAPAAPSATGPRCSRCWPSAAPRWGSCAWRTRGRCSASWRPPACRPRAWRCARRADPRGWRRALGFARPRPDVVVSRGVSGLLVAEAIARRAGAPHVVNEHTPLTADGRAAPPAPAPAPPHAAGGAAGGRRDRGGPAPGASRWPRWASARERIEVIANGIAPLEPPPGAQRLAGEDEFGVLCVSRLEPEKRVDLFVRGGGGGAALGAAPARLRGRRRARAGAASRRSPRRRPGWSCSASGRTCPPCSPAPTRSRSPARPRRCR